MRHKHFNFVKFEFKTKQETKKNLQEPGCSWNSPIACFPRPVTIKRNSENIRNPSDSYLVTQPNEYCSVSVLITQHFGSVFPRLFLIGPVIKWSQTAFTTVIRLKPVVQAYNRKLLIIRFEIYLWNTERDYFWKSRTESKRPL